MRFDYVLIGGGTSACVAASQLLDHGLGTVAIIESGGEPYGPRIFTPVRYTETFSSSWDFGLKTVPQTNLTNRQLQFPRGKMLGGSSGNNAMIYIPPSRTDLESWPDEWQYEKILPVMRQIEERLFDVGQNPPAIHSLSQRFLKSIDEHNRLKRQSEGLSRSELEDFQAVRYRQTQSHGRRRGAFSAFLKPLLGHPSLTVFSHCNASRIVIRDGKAVAVAFGSPTDETIIDANVAVILAAGTVFSPIILMQSGIGPREVLIEHGLDTVVDLPGVGTNLQDHLIVPLIFESKNERSLEKEFSDATRLAYLRDRSGQKTSNIAEVGAFFHVQEGDSSYVHSDSRGNDDHSEMQIHFTPTHYLEYPTRQSPRCAWTIGVSQCNPLSRGTIGLATEFKTRGNVCIHPNYLGNDFDLRMLLRGVRKALEIAFQPSLSEVRGEMLLPRSIGEDPIDDERIRKFIQRYALTLYHPVGTCAIGNGESDTVVDHALRVRGIENLHVADASIIPTLPRANPQSIAMLVGFKIAEMLQEKRS